MRLTTGSAKREKRHFLRPFHYVADRQLETIRLYIAFSTIIEEVAYSPFSINGSDAPLSLPILIVTQVRQSYE